MEQFVDWILNLPPALVQVVSYLIIFLGSIIEGIPPLWFLFPCWLILCIAWFLANLGLISFPIAIFLAVSGAFIGEMFAYKLWGKYGMTFFQKTSKRLPISDAVFEKVQNVTKKNLIFWMFFSKLYGWLRGFIPFMAWVSKVHKVKVALCVFFSGAMRWVGFTMLGYLLGESYVIIVQKIGTFLLWWGIIAITIAVSLWIIKSKYNMFTRKFTFLGLTSIFSVFALWYLTQQHVNHVPLFIDLDLQILHRLDDISWIGIFAKHLTNIFNFQCIGILWILIVFYLYRKKLLFHLSVFFSSMVSCIFAFPLVKMLVSKSLRGNYFGILNDYGYPSWYAMTSIVLCLLLGYIFQLSIEKKRVRILFCIGMVLIGIIIGLSTIEKHTYKCTDLIGWFLLWIFLFTLNTMIWKVIFQRHKDGKKTIELSSRKKLLDLLTE